MAHVCGYQSFRVCQDSDQVHVPSAHACPTDGDVSEQPSIFPILLAILSENTDLLEKAKLEKKIASLEGERKSFNKGRRETERKLESKTATLSDSIEKARGMTEDWEKFTAAVQTDKDGNRLNTIRVDGLEQTDEIGYPEILVCKENRSIKL